MPPVPGQNLEAETKAGRTCSGTEMEAGRKQVESVMGTTESLGLVDHMPLAGSGIGHLGLAAVEKWLAGCRHIALLDWHSAACKSLAVPVHRTFRTDQ